MTKKAKLELPWIGKENRPKLESRILLEDPDKSYHAAQRVIENDIFDNRLIHGDNLLALEALEQEFTGKVKCIFIDPPYNTGSAFQHYDDGIEHSLWLSLKPLAFTAPADEAIHNFRHPPNEFSPLLWITKQRSGSSLAAASSKSSTGGVPTKREYQPDFVAETGDAIYMLEPKMRKEMDDKEGVAKKESAVRGCQLATDHASKNGGKPWRYLLIPHDAIAENMSIRGLRRNLPCVDRLTVIRGIKSG